MSHYFFSIIFCILFSTSCVARPLLFLKGSDTVGEILALELAKGYLVEKYGYNKDDCATKTMQQNQSHNENKFLTYNIVCQNNTGNKYIKIEASGSNTAVDCLFDSECDIAMSSNTIEGLVKTSNNSTAKLKLEESDPLEIALDGIVVIVNRVNSLNNISKEELKTYFCKEKAQWGNDAPSKDTTEIIRIGRNTDSGTLSKLSEYLDNCSIYLEQTEDSNINVSAKVSMEPRAIGFIGFPFIGLTKPLSIDKVPPNLVNLVVKYPLRRKLILFTKRPATKDVLDFLDFINGDTGQDIIVKSGFAPIQQEISPETHLDNQPIIEAVRGYNPEITLLFDIDSPDLKLRQQIKIAKFAQSIKSNALVKILGYADQGGASHGYNKRLSELRASRVEIYLKDKLNDNGIKLNCTTSCSEGLGDHFSLNLRDPKYRKVEIWVRRHGQ